MAWSREDGYKAYGQIEIREYFKCGCVYDIKMVRFSLRNTKDYIKEIYI